MTRHELSACLLLPALLVACGSSGANGGATGGVGGTNSTGAGGTAPSGGSGSGAGPSESTGATVCSAEPSHTGVATYYTFADGSGNCGFDKTPNDLMVGAMNAADYQGSAACGGCAEVDGPNGSISIRIVDQCPECALGQIDLSPSAFDGIAARAQGRVPITWHYAACAETGPLGYFFKDGSSQYWTAVQIRHHRNRVAKFEVQKNGAFVDVHRETYNYFVDASGMGPGPYTFRVTDVYGNTLTDTGITLKVLAEVPGKAQLPACQ